MWRGPNNSVKELVAALIWSASMFDTILRGNFQSKVDVVVNYFSIKNNLPSPKLCSVNEVLFVGHLTYFRWDVDRLINSNMVVAYLISEKPGRT